MELTLINADSSPNSSLVKPSPTNAQPSLSKSAQQKVDSCLALYPAAADFTQSFSIEQADYYLQQGRDLMVTDQSIPTLATARNAYSLATAKLIVKQHLFQLSQSMGVTATEQGVDAIAEDIISGYSDLRITELILAFKLMREGRFREGSNQERDACQFYGTLSSQVICNCLYRYRVEYRNPILQSEEQEQLRVRREEADRNAATPRERNKILLASCLSQLQVPTLLQTLLQTFLSPKEMTDLQYYVEERKMHLLLRQRVREFVEGKVDATALTKAIDYLDKKFPVSNGDNTNAQPS